ncbi:peptidoglycan DD-metalloendopeptidase family protein [Halobacillus litoralis]|uniref:Peptidoglycan DD-metalloendopeptidase family protein n=1 Tax=Halobacillus litoralis TaxID=45668 RepID=A0A845F5Z2_9BACI|nr:peptidoglycan DD-metalloendopeptidase family protein [Halobacillus litoralis]MYL69309.1 peptidoglycan DD-metalloendopeptidase family protein [Halobacillus litoralis]
MWKKLAVTAISVVSVGVGTVYAESSLPTVYHVYIDEQHVGMVEDQAEIKAELRERMEEAEKDHKGLDLSYMEEVSFKEQKVFSVNDESSKVMDSLQNELTFAVDIVRLNIDGKPVAHLPNEEKAEQVIESVKEEYVGDGELAKLENGTPELPDIGETKVMDVGLSLPVTMEEDQVALSQVHTVDEAVSRVEEGRIYPSNHSEATSFIGMMAKSKKPLVDVVFTKKERKEEVIPHKVQMKKSDELYKGESEVKQEGEEGKRELLIERTYRNGEELKEEVVEKEVVKEPVKKIVLQGTKRVPSKGTGDFSWPAVGGQITSKQGERWGRYHKGIDIAGVSDKTIKAADYGKVIEAGYRKSFGNKVVIDHGNGYETIYAHLSSIDVKKGQSVKKGEKIGVMGTTGRSTGVHLHFEIHKEGSLENPLSHVSR